MVPGLSDAARRRLYAESNKYASALVRYAKLKRGNDAACRYAEVLALVEFFVATTHTHRQLLEAMVVTLAPQNRPRPVKLIEEVVVG